MFSAFSCGGVYGIDWFIQVLLEAMLQELSQSHGIKKLKPEPDTFYMKEIEVKAFIKPAFLASNLTSKAIDVILQQTLTLKEWETVFLDLLEKCLSGWMTIIPFTSNLWRKVNF